MTDATIPTPPGTLDVPRPNLPLLRKVLDFIDAHPGEWNQSAFEDEEVAGCGTTRCIAGWVNFWEYGDAYGTWNGPGAMPAAHAQALLGLNNAETDALFFQTIDLTPATERANVQRVAESIAARGGERL